MKKLIKLDPKPKTIAELYAIPGTWCQGSMYKRNNPSGGLVPTGRSHATCCCLGAAVGLIYGPDLSINEHLAMTREELVPMDTAIDKIKTQFIRMGFDKDKLLPWWNDYNCKSQEEAHALAVAAGV